jgi:antitoxin MazE
MQQTLSSWGNSVGIRIPQHIRKTLHLEEGAKVTLEIINNSIVIKPQKVASNIVSEAQKININALCKKVNNNNKPQLEDDSPVGKELW